MTNSIQERVVHNFASEINKRDEFSEEEVEKIIQIITRDITVDDMIIQIEDAIGDKKNEDY